VFEGSTVYIGPDGLKRASINSNRQPANGSIRSHHMLSSFLGPVLAAAMLVGVAATPAAAAELVGSPPLSGFQGVQVDAATGSLSQEFKSPVSGLVKSIVWWGYHLPPSEGASSDEFIVLLNGEDQTGDLTKTEEGVLTRYELDIVDTPLVAGELGELDILNDSEDVLWFWQYSEFPQTLAFSLQGTIPEPNSMALVALAGLAWVAVRRQRKG
jgi:hypothetical protein